MNNTELREAFADLSTPLIADALIRMDEKPRLAPPGIRPLNSRHKLAGCACPVRHGGSVDVFLEAMLNAQHGDVMVIDNQGREDEACIGDLTVLEAKANGLFGVVLWGLHRDTPELLDLDHPVFSYGSLPCGPTRLDDQGAQALQSAEFGTERVGREDAVFADADGVVFVHWTRLDELIPIACEIRDKEREQAQKILEGDTLLDQLQFAKYLRQRRSDPTLTFRRHLRHIGGAIEE